MPIYCFETKILLFANITFCQSGFSGEMWICQIMVLTKYGRIFSFLILYRIFLVFISVFPLLILGITGGICSVGRLQFVDPSAFSRRTQNCAGAQNSGNLGSNFQHIFSIKRKHKYTVFISRKLII